GLDETATDAVRREEREDRILNRHDERLVVGEAAGECRSTLDPFVSLQPANPIELGTVGLTDPGDLPDAAEERRRVRDVGSRAPQEEVDSASLAEGVGRIVFPVTYGDVDADLLE